MSHRNQDMLEESRQGEVLTLLTEPKQKNGLGFYVESYGCAMNFSDSEIVASILTGEGYHAVNDFNDADLILVNTCSIREKAEQTVRKRLTEFRKAKRKNREVLIGVLGCMAERLKEKFLEEEKLVDLLVGPDAYRDLPRLIEQAGSGQKAVNVLLSREETYAEINPVRLNSNGISAFISIMRGCNNMCSFCVVPFTRGRERSRNPFSIIEEAKQLSDQGFKEITLLGQNVDSYNYVDENSTVNFAQLLEMVALVNSKMRVRFSTSHPKDITDEVLETIAKHQNICKYIHLPLQSGNNRILKMMNRTYTSEWYKERVESIRRIIPGCGISTDMIVGFCSETETDHADTLAMMDWVRYDMAYMYKYSERPGTLAQRQYPDDVPETDKGKRLQQMVDLQMQHQLEMNQFEVGKTYEVLVEGFSKKSDDYLVGRSSQNKVIVFPKENFVKGDYVYVTISGYTSATLTGEAAPNQNIS